MRTKKIPVYRAVAQDIYRKIRHGFFVEKLPSQSELCSSYNISAMTAVRVQEALERAGHAYKIRGKGMFISPQFSDTPISESTQLIRRLVVYINDKCSMQNMPHDYAILKGIKRRAAERSLPLRIVSSRLDQKPSLQVNEDEALLFPYRTNFEHLIPMFQKKNVKVIVINNYYPTTHCIVGDNHLGIATLLDYLQNRACRSFVMAAGLFSDLGLANLSERSYAFCYECRQRKLEHSLLTNGNDIELMQLILNPETCPDALMFSIDDKAIKFWNQIQPCKLQKRPLISSLDFCLHLPPGIIGYAIDYEAMGVSAVDLSQNNSLEDWLLPIVTHIPGRLVINSP